MTLLDQEAQAGADLRVRIAAIATQEIADHMLAASESDSISAKNRALQKSHFLLLEIRAALGEPPHVSAEDAPTLVTEAEASGAEAPAEAQAILTGPAEAADETAPPDQSWFVVGDNEALGPFGFSEMREMAFSGALQPQSLVVRSGGDAWIEADQDEALRFMLHGSPAPVISAPPPPAVEEPRAEPKRRGIRLFLRSKG